MDIQGMIWEYVWHARTVTVHRRIVKHNSDPRRNVQAAKTSLKQARAKRSRRKHRDKVLHSVSTAMIIPHPLLDWPRTNHFRHHSRILTLNRMQ